jgi:hypothetical protein
MPLQDEGTDVWRPVQVRPLEGAVYRVEGMMPPDERWEYPPGSIIQLKWKRFSDGQQRLIPAGVAPTVRSAFADHYKRMSGMSLGSLPAFAILDRLPREPHGQPEPVPLLLSSAALVLVAILGMTWLKPRCLVGRWGLGSGLAMGCLLLLTNLGRAF